MEEKHWLEIVEVVSRQMKEGIFLNTRLHDQNNTMIIGWGGLQFLWGRPIVMIYVRDQRYTHSFLTENPDFTLSVPAPGTLKKAIGICGTVSGRNQDKFQLANITPIQAKHVNASIIQECSTHLECRVIYRQILDAKDIPQDITTRYYAPGNDSIHTVYYADFIAAYQRKDDSHGNNH